MKWRCSEQGCWNEACRPPLEYFASAFPRKIGMTDLDATVELNGHFLFLEWKTHDGELSTGQRLYFERLTQISEKITVVVVHAGNSPTDVERVCVIYTGETTPWQPCTFEELYERVCKWVTRVTKPMERVA